MSGERWDVAVVGAGPVGAAAALAFARRGARVVLLEANPAASTRLAGEWLHPPGVDVLRRLGVDLLADGEGPTPGRGFAVFPDDGSDPVVLPYPDGMTGASLEHHALASLVRARAAAHPGVTLRLGARVRAVHGGRLELAGASEGGTAVETIEAGRVIGADGRSSVVRRALGLSEDATPMSSMAGVELRGATLPFEGFGHVVLGGPGPVLMYRIGPDRVRACLDVPHEPHGDGRRREPAALWDAFAPVLPAEVLPAFRRALDEKRVQWAAVGFRPRAHYGDGPVALAGDAVGYFHPMTAAGMSLGLADAERLAATPDVEAYRREREAESWVPELLACGLYQALARPDPSAVALRQAVYRMWRRSPGEARRTMRILACAETRTDEFRSAFNSVVWELVRGSPSKIPILGDWLRWGVASVVPGPVRRAYRARSTPARPLWSSRGDA